jgi:hypothetical protein
VMPGLAAYELGVWHALDGRVPLADPTTIARYAATHGRNPEPLKGHIASLMYEEGFKQGTEDKELALPPDGHDYLIALDRIVAGG